MLPYVKGDEVWGISPPASGEWIETFSAFFLFSFSAASPPGVGGVDEAFRWTPAPHAFRISTPASGGGGLAHEHRQHDPRRGRASPPGVGGSGLKPAAGQGHDRDQGASPPGVGGSGLKRFICGEMCRR